MYKNRKIFLTAIIFFIILFMASCTQKSVTTENNNTNKVSTPQTSQSEAVKPPDNYGKVSIAAVGDNLIHLEIINDAKTKNGGYDFEPIYANIKDDISKADIAVVNQETILGGAKLGYSGYPRFNSPQEVGKALVDLGFDVINHANNHVLDKGMAGINSELEFWKNYPNILVTGMYGSSEDRQKIRVIDKNGIKVAFLAYTFGTNGLPIPKDKPYCVSLIDKNLMASDIKRAREVADAVVVSMHWGIEYAPAPSKTQTDLAQFLADEGVNLVIGNHPHVLQPVELVKGKNGNETLVAYSLGNLISAQDQIPRLLGGLLKVNLVKNKDGSISIEDPSLTPLVTQYYAGGKGFKVYPLDEYTAALAKQHGIAKYGQTLTLDKLDKIAAPVIKSVDDAKNTLMVINSSSTTP